MTTPRSKTDLLVLLADNIVGAISEEDLRDCIDSILGGFASLKVVAGVTSQTVSATAAKMTGWAADGLAVGLIPAHASDDIEIDVDGNYDIVWDICFAGTNSKTYLVALYKDVGAGFIDAGSPRIERKLGTGGDVGSSKMSDRLALSAGDKIACYVWSSDGGTSFIPREGTFSAKRIG